MNPYSILCALVLAGALAFGAYVQGRKDGRNACLAAEARDEKVAQIAGAAAAASAAEAISQIEVKHVTIRQQLETQVREIPVFRDCHAPADSVRKLNAALTGADEAAAPVELPAASAAH